MMRDVGQPVIAIGATRFGAAFGGGVAPSLEVSMNVLNRRWWSRIGPGLLATPLATQLVPYGHDRINPPAMGEPAWDSPTTRALAKQACFDCHSNETEWPAYSRVRASLVARSA
jgi:Haem-binding domain